MEALSKVLRDGTYEPLCYSSYDYLRSIGADVRAPWCRCDSTIYASSMLDAHHRGIEYYVPCIHSLCIHSVWNLKNIPPKDIYVYDGYHIKTTLFKHAIKRFDVTYGGEIAERYRQLSYAAYLNTLVEIFIRKTIASYRKVKSVRCDEDGD
jgi:hypothetical protein